MTKPQRRRNTVDGRCPKCTTGCMFVAGCMNAQVACKYHVDDL